MTDFEDSMARTWWLIRYRKLEAHTVVLPELTIESLSDLQLKLFS